MFDKPSGARRFFESAHRFHGPITAWIILFLSLSITLAAYFIAASHQQARSQQKFRYEAQEITQLIDNRMALYVSALRGGVALIDASEHVTRQEWKNYVDRLNLRALLPGIQGMGLSIPVPAEQLAAHRDTIRREGFPNYQVKPAGERDFYSAIIYLEPFDWRNQRAFGYDMWSNPARRSAMQRAWKTGLPSASSMITLVQETKEDVQRGFLIYLPVYQEPGNPSSGLHGWVYAAFRVKDLMRGILRPSDSNIEFKIYDGDTTDSASKMYDTNVMETGARGNQNIFSVTQKLDVYGRLWTLVYEVPLTALISDRETIKPGYILVAGLTIDALLFIVLLSLAFLNRKLGGVQKALLIANGKIKKDLEKKQENLNFSERKNDTFLELAPVALILISHQGKIINANTMVHTLFGYDEGALLGKSIDLLLPQARKGQDKVEACDDVFEFFGDIVSSGCEFCMVAERQDGHKFIAKLHARTIAYDKRQSNIALVIKDDTEQQNFERGLSQAKARAEQASKLKGQFVANMSHEIRTPLNAVLGSAQLLEKTDLSRQQVQYISMIKTAGEALSGLINDILDFSKIEEGQLSLVNAPFSLDEFMSRIDVFMRLNIGEKRVTPVIDIDPGLHDCFIGDSFRLQQVLLNLISNAIKFTSEGNVVLSLEHQADSVLKSRTSDAGERYDLIRFAVTDTGIGIAPDQRKNLFKAFSQADSSITRRFGGTGLGLVISNRLVQMMGGEIEVQSKPGEGATFSFSLRLTHGPSEAYGERPTCQMQQVYLIENHTASAESLKKTCGRFCEVISAFPTGKDFLDVALPTSRTSALARAQEALAVINWESCRDGAQFQEVLNELTKRVGSRRRVFVTCDNNQDVQNEVNTYLRNQDNILIKPITYLGLSSRIVEIPHDLAQHNAPVQPIQTHKLARAAHVLLVEDVDFNQIIATSMLDELGVQWTLATNGKEAIEKYQNTPQLFDAILIDVQMPVMDGVKATQILREHYHCTTPIVALTAAVLKSEHDSYLLAGMDDLLPKPIDYHALEQLLEKIMLQRAHVA